MNPQGVNTQLCSSLLFLAHCFASPVCVDCAAASQRLQPTSSYKLSTDVFFPNLKFRQTDTECPAALPAPHEMAENIRKHAAGGVNRLWRGDELGEPIKECLLDNPFSDEWRESATWI